MNSERGNEAMSERQMTSNSATKYFVHGVNWDDVIPALLTDLHWPPSAEWIYRAEKMTGQSMSSWKTDPVANEVHVYFRDRCK